MRQESRASARGRLAMMGAKLAEPVPVLGGRPDGFALTPGALASTGSMIPEDQMRESNAW